MPVLVDIPIALQTEQIISSGRNAKIRPGLLRDAEKALALAQNLWQPRIVYDWFEVGAVEGEQLQLRAPAPSGQEVALRIGPKADLLAPAEMALVSVITIGPALEEQVHQLQVAGEGLLSYLLDSAGVVALGAAGETLRCLAEEAAAERGWGVSPSLSPGSLVGWPLRGQRELCALLPIEKIDVHLNQHHVLEPHKSVSALVGLGSGYESNKVGSVCKYCALKDTCWRRREDPS
jgi:hypothetical protein